MTALILVRLTLRGVVTDIPHDLAAFVTYVLLLVFAGFVFIGGRRTGRPPTPPVETPPGPAEPRAHSLTPR